MRNTTMTKPSKIDSPRPARENRAYLGHLLVHAASRLREQTASALAALDISPREFGLLNQVAAHKAQTQAQLGAVLGIDRTTIMIMLDRFSALGWIERCADPLDRRVHRISCTGSGQSVHRQARKAVDMVEREFLKPLSSEQALELATALEALHTSTPSP
jgi:MarR family transcriptional regulator, transcriptional regulator for hemolysin